LEKKEGKTKKRNSQPLDMGKNKGPFVQIRKIPTVGAEGSVQTKEKPERFKSKSPRLQDQGRWLGGKTKKRRVAKATQGGLRKGNSGPTTMW